MSFKLSFKGMISVILLIGADTERGCLAAGTALSIGYYFIFALLFSSAFGSKSGSH